MINNHNIKTMKRKLSDYMNSLSLDECNSKKLKKKTNSVYCQTDEKIYTESDIKEMIDNYVNYINTNTYTKKIEPNKWVESF